MSSRFAPYRQALSALSARTKTPLPSLIFSFAVLHELTALVPLVGVFYGAKTFGVGEKIVSAVVDDDPEDGQYGWVREKCKIWVEEGESWAGRIGRRYGVLGFEKGQKPDGHRHEIAGDVANAVFAYGMTKALLPVRIGLSLYLSPAFSRGVIEPIRRTVIRPFRRPPPAS